MMKLIVVAAAIALAASPASPRSAVPPQSERTVMWYVGHPAELRAVMAACQNNPGAAKHNPDCENVVQAELVLSADHASAMTDMTPPSNPRYWFIHPDELGPQLFDCSHTQSPAMRRALWCDSAEAAEKMR